MITCNAMKAPPFHCFNNVVQTIQVQVEVMYEKFSVLKELNGIL